MTVIVVNAVILTISAGVMFNVGRVRNGRKLKLLRFLGWLASLVIFCIYLHSLLFAVKYIKGDYAYTADNIYLKGYQNEISSLDPYDKVIIVEDNINPVTLILNPFMTDWFTLSYEPNTEYVTVSNPEIFQIDETAKQAIHGTSYISDGTVCYAVDIVPSKISTDTVYIGYAEDAMSSIMYNGDILYCFTDATVINN